MIHSWLNAWVVRDFISHSLHSVVAWLQSETCLPCSKEKRSYNWPSKGFDERRGFILANTPPLICISLNKNSSYCYIPRSSKDTDTCNGWAGVFFNRSFVFSPRKLNHCFWRGKHDLISHRTGVPVNTILLSPSAHSMADARHNTLFSALNIPFRLQNRLLFCTDTKI